MQIHLFVSGTTRLRLLKEAQPRRPWHSCDEQRECLVCENIFTGREVVIQREEGTRLACPACDSGPECWVRPGNPLLDESVWADWERAIADAELRGDEDELARA